MIRWGLDLPGPFGEKLHRVAWNGPVGGHFTRPGLLRFHFGLCKDHCRLQDGTPKISFSCLISGWILWFMIDIIIVDGDHNWDAPSCIDAGRLNEKKFLVKQIMHRNWNGDENMWNTLKYHIWGMNIHIYIYIHIVISWLQISALLVFARGPYSTRVSRVSSCEDQTVLSTRCRRFTGAGALQIP